MNCQNYIKMKLSLLQILCIVCSIILTFWLFDSGSWGCGIIVLFVIFLRKFKKNRGLWILVAGSGRFKGRQT